MMIREETYVAHQHESGGRAYGIAFLNIQRPSAAFKA